MDDTSDVTKPVAADFYQAPWTEHSKAQQTLDSPFMHQ